MIGTLYQVPIGESDWRNCIPRPYTDSRNDVVVRQTACICALFRLLTLSGILS
jgi:hypothetical protein